MFTKHRVAIQYRLKITFSYIYAKIQRFRKINLFNCYLDLFYIQDFRLVLLFKGIFISEGLFSVQAHTVVSVKFKLEMVGKQVCINQFKFLYFNMQL